jgi:hypothetical protein
MSYHDTVRKHRRLAILRHLEQCGEYTSNASILTDVLAGVGVHSTRAQVTTELIWLQDSGFVRLTDHGEFVVATATQEGVEVAQGLSVHPDIQRPRPRV